jgi:hypothetical protein
MEGVDDWDQSASLDLGATPRRSTSSLEPMKRDLMFGTAVLLLTSAATVGGYWLGFRHGCRLGLMADAAPRGAVAIGNIRLLDKGQTDSVRFYLESELDSGLMWWHELDRFPLRRALNTLSGGDVIPGDEMYVRRLAIYRKEHPSPLEDPKLNQEMLEHIPDPSVVKNMEEGDRAKRQAIKEMLQKYAQQ